MGLNVSILRGVSLFVAGALALWADGPRLAITEIHYQLPVVKAYLDVLDSNGQPPAGLTPASFSGTLNATPLSVTNVKAFKDSAEAIAYLFVIDISRSIPPPDFGQMQQAVIRWISSLRSGDRVAIATFGDNYKVIQGFTGDKNHLIEVVTGLSVQDNTTHFYEAIQSSLETARQADSSVAERRLILIASDGDDEGSNISEQQLIGQLQTSSLPLYTIGYASVASSKRKSLDVLRRLSEASGGAYAQSAGHSFDTAFAAIKDAIFRVFEVDLSCQGCTSGAKNNPLEITLVSTGQKVGQPVPISLAAGGAVKPVNGATTSGNSWLQGIPAWLYAVAGIALLAVLFLINKAKGKSATQIRAELPHIPVPPIFKEPPAETPETAPSTNGLPIQVAVVTGQDRGRVFRLRLESTLVIGRAPDCDVVLDDPHIADRHCEVLLAKNIVVVQALDSKNRVYLSGVAISGRRRVENDDSLLLGETEVRLRF